MRSHNLQLIDVMALILICRVILMFVWIYQGLIPKLMILHPDEMRLNEAVGIPADLRVSVAYLAGYFEIALGVAIAVFWKHCWPLWGSIIMMVIFLIGVILYAPEFLEGAFNPIVSNIPVIGLSVIALQLQKNRESEVNLTWKR